MNTQTVVGVVVVLVAVVGGYLLFSKPALPEGPVKVGVIAPLTGDAALYGEPLRNVMDLAVAEINASGGVNGSPLELIYEDGKCNGKDATSAAQKLISVDGVVVIIGGFCSGEALAAEPVATAAKVALFSASASSPALTGKSPYFSRNYPSDSSQGAVLAEIAYADKGWRKVSILQEQTDYAAGITASFTTTFKNFDGAVSEDKFAVGETDFRALITKIKAEKPDAVFVVAQAGGAADRLLTQMSELGLRSPLFVTDTIIGDSVTLGKHAALLEGAVGAEFGVDTTNATFAALASKYRSTYNSEMPFQSYAQTEYDAVFLVRDAIQSVGYDGTKIARWFRSVKDWKGASGFLTIDANGDPVAGHRAEVVLGGKVVPYTE